MSEPVPPIGYLLECSKHSLKCFVLARMNESSELRKHLQQLLPEWVEATALAMLAEWFEKHGEALLVIAAADPPERRQLLAGLSIAFPVEQSAQTGAVADANIPSVLGLKGGG
jgi:hypothetical protein